MIVKLTNEDLLMGNRMDFYYPFSVGGSEPAKHLGVVLSLVKKDNFYTLCDSAESIKKLKNKNILINKGVFYGSELDVLFTSKDKDIVVDVGYYLLGYGRAGKKVFKEKQIFCTIIEDINDLKYEFVSEYKSNFEDKSFIPFFFMELKYESDFVFCRKNKENSSTYIFKVL